MQASLEELLACPRCRAAVGRGGDSFVCPSAGCGFRGEIVDGIISVVNAGTWSSFDTAFPVMVHGTGKPGAYAAFYAQQVEALRGRLDDARVILDVGCGPRAYYSRPPGSLLLGIDMSRESLRQNRTLDVRLHGSAARLPLLEASVDVVLCFYSLHHFVGTRREDTAAMVEAAFGEFARVLRPGGSVLVFEVAPRPWAWILQTVGWNSIRRLLGRRFDMFFWSRPALTEMGRRALPPATTFEYMPFEVPSLTMFPPAFALQWLQVPRVLYPFDICLYHWRILPALRPEPRRA